MSYREVHDLTPLLKQTPPIVVGFDTETQSLRYKSQNGVFISYSVSWAPGEAYQVFMHEECNEDDADFMIVVDRHQWWGNDTGPTDVFVRKSENFNIKLKQLYDLMASPNFLLVMHHGTYDLHWVHELFARYGETPPDVQGYVMDTQVAAQVLDNERFPRASLAKLSEALLGSTTQWKAETKHAKNDMLALPRQTMIEYACTDADMTRQVAMVLRDRLQAVPASQNYFLRFAQPITANLLFALEHNGAMVDTDQLRRVKGEMAEVVHQEYWNAVNLVPEHIVQKHGGKELLTKNDFVADVIYDGFGVQCKSRTPKGARRIDKKTRATIRKYERIPDAAAQFIDHFDQWSETQGFIARYLLNFDALSVDDGRLHPSYTLSKSRTGRVSTTDPNLMNLPKRSKLSGVVRRLFTAAPGHKLLAFDVSQSELRWLAHISRDPEMIRVYRNNEDIHTNTARSIVGSDEWGKLSSDLQKKKRKEAKSLNFGLIYGMGVKTFVDYARTDYGIQITEKTAQEWIDRFFDTYQAIKVYHNAALRFCRQHGYVVSPFGRRRYIPNILSKNHLLQSKAERQAINHPIQSVSSDAFLFAWYMLLQKPEAVNIRPILFVHDEMVIEVPDDDGVPGLRAFIRHELENAPIQDVFGFVPLVPFRSDCTEGYNLAEMAEVEE